MKKPRVLVTQPVHAEVRTFLETFSDPWIHPGVEPMTLREKKRRASEVEGLMVFMSDRIDADFLDACPRLRIVSAALKGHDNFDVAACRERGIWFTIVPDLLTEPTADLAIGLALGLARRIPEGDAHVRGGGFAGWRPRFYGSGFSGKTFGLVGLGAVGRALARRLAGFGCRVLYCDKRRASEEEERALGVAAVSLEGLLAESDFVVPLVHLTSETFHLLVRERLRAMKPGALLVNVARGSIVDEKAVAEALECGALGGYAADVFEREDHSRPIDPPPEIPRALLDHPRTLFTPHLGSAVGEVRLAIEGAAARQLEAGLRGERPEHAVGDPFPSGESHFPVRGSCVRTGSPAQTPVDAASDPATVSSFPA